MTKKNPDDSVRKEQFGANENAAGTEDATQAENAQESDTLNDPGKPADKTEKVTENEVPKPEEISVAADKKEEPVHEETHEFEDIELPQVDYSGYSKHELVETLSLIIENRPPVEIRDDVERIKILFYKKLKSESEERKTNFSKVEEKLKTTEPGLTRMMHV